MKNVHDLVLIYHCKYQTMADKTSMTNRHDCAY